MWAKVFQDNPTWPVSTRNKSISPVTYFIHFNTVVCDFQLGLQSLKDYPQTLWLALFVEGTRFTQAKLLAAQEYASSNGLPVPRNVLIPRTKVRNHCNIMEKIISRVWFIFYSFWVCAYVFSVCVLHNRSKHCLIISSSKLTWFVSILFCDTRLPVVL